MIIDDDVDGPQQPICLPCHYQMTYVDPVKFLMHLLASGPIAFLLTQIFTHTAWYDQLAEEADQSEQSNLSFSHIELVQVCLLYLAMMNSSKQTRAHNR